MFGVIGYMRITGNIKLVAFVTTVFLRCNTNVNGSSRFLKWLELAGPLRRHVGKGDRMPALVGRESEADGVGLLLACLIPPVGGMPVAIWGFGRNTEKHVTFAKLWYIAAAGSEVERDIHFGEGGGWVDTLLRSEIVLTQPYY